MKFFGAAIEISFCLLLTKFVIKLFDFGIGGNDVFYDCISTGFGDQDPKITTQESHQIASANDQINVDLFPDDFGLSLFICLVCFIRFWVDVGMCD